jgi:monofunctional glycosyltransferase
MAVEQARIARRVLLGSAAICLVWLVGVWPPPLWWRDHTPRCTAMMRVRDDCADRRADGRRLGPSVHPPAVLERMVIIAEDSRFRTHHGIDFIELRDAWSGGGRRGASTITQQLAKNLYLSPSRSLLRKMKEAVTAVRLELALPKERILALYLATAEWGPGIWGLDAASEAYFGMPADRLRPAQAAALAATLPQPRTSNPAFRPERMLARRDLILARFYGAKTPLPPIIPVLPIDSLVDSLVHQP